MNRIDLTWIQTYAARTIPETLLLHYNNRPQKLKVELIESLTDDLIRFMALGTWVGWKHPPQCEDHQRIVHVTIPRGWRDWRRVAKGKEPHRTRDIAVKVTVQASGTPELVFPECDIQFPTDRLGPTMYVWESPRLTIQEEGDLA